jgi:hypothetical protein
MRGDREHFFVKPLNRNDILEFDRVLQACLRGAVAPRGAVGPLAGLGSGPGVRAPGLTFCSGMHV